MKANRHVTKRILASIPFIVAAAGCVNGNDQLLVPQDLLVAAGGGTGVLSATVVPSHYMRTSDFAVGVLLSGHPHPAEWIPVARDKRSVSLSP